MHNEVSIAAPAQVANMFGFFDCAGFLCKAPPRTEESRTGGVGDIITVEIVPEQSDILTIEYLLRRFDNEAYWKGVEKFSDLAEDIKSHPDRDIIKIVLNATLQKIAELKPDLEASTKLPIKVTVTKCLPAGRVGIGLGSSASSTAIALAIDKLFGDPLRLLEEEEAKRTGTDPLLRLRLMALGEQLVSGSQFLITSPPYCPEDLFLYQTTKIV